MDWRKDVKTSHVKSFDIIAFTAAVLFVIGLVTGQFFVYLVAGMLTAHLILLKLFDRHVLTKLTLRNPQRTIRLFPGEEATLDIHLKNESMFPLLHGEITWSMGKQVKVAVLNEDLKRTVIPATLPAQQQLSIKIPITAIRRGTSKIKQVSYRYSHLFNFHDAVIDYNHEFATEFIVYPELKVVQGIESVFHPLPGASPYIHSPYEDILDPIGTRDYTYTDSFQRINWKASVRSNTLQTNVYQRIVDRAYLFLVNFQTEMKTGALQISEDLISYTAYLCDYAARSNQEYELMLNVLRPDQAPHIHQHQGTGKVQLAKSLELLARIPRQPATEPFENMLYQVTKIQRLPKTIVILGSISEEARLQLRQLLLLGHTIFHVERKADFAAIVPLRLENIA